MKFIRVHNYEILNFEPTPIIFSATGFTKIHETKIINILQKLKEAPSNYIDTKKLEQLATNEKLQPIPAIEFLKSIKIIEEKTSHPYFNSATLFTDIPISQEIAAHLKYSNISINPSKSSPCDIPDGRSKEIFIFAFLKINPNQLREAYIKILDRNPTCGAVIGFASGNFFHLTECHLPSIGNPCAFCTLDRVAYYERLKPSHHHWSKIWSFCQLNDIDLPTANIDALQKSLILGMLTVFVSKMTEAPKFKITQDRVLASRTLNLETGHIIEDTSIHWPFCQCLEPKP
ncbi:TPA: McbB family protein [Pseudomonas putida]|nr:McbB family protein [Pseudomonas putida]